MQNIQATLTATFRKGNLFLIGHSPNLEDPGNDKLFVDYLYSLSQQGWRITQAGFEGFILNVDLEKSATVTIPYPLNPAIPVYLFHSFYISYVWFPVEQKALSEKFHETIRSDGWKELCTSKLLRAYGEWILSLWMK